jgi:hypothetical protein
MQNRLHRKALQMRFQVSTTSLFKKDSMCAWLQISLQINNPLKNINAEPFETWLATRTHNQKILNMW